MPIDAKLQRRIMGCFATGVTVVTTRCGDQFHGMTANAVASLSLDPPLVLVAVDKNAGFYASLREGGFFAMSILDAGQRELSDRFAQRGPKEFGDLNIEFRETGAPILADALGFVDCTVSDILSGGDHDIFVGEILDGQCREGEPLLFFAGRYRYLGDA